jgi:hypothetical protein
MNKTKEFWYAFDNRYIGDNPEVIQLYQLKQIR